MAHDETIEIKPMAHGDLHRLCMSHILDAVPVTFGTMPRVLDLGAGSGSLSKMLVEAGFDVQACDLEPSLFKCPGVECRRADFSGELPYDTGEFDAVVSLEVLEHLDGHLPVFKEVERLLRPGGTFVFSTPNVMSLKSRVRFLMLGFEHSYGPLEPGQHEPQGWHLSGYGASRYRFVLDLAGLDFEKLSYDKVSHTSAALVGLAPVVKLWSRLKFRGVRGAELNNSWAALFGRSMVGVARKPEAAWQPRLLRAA